MTNTPLAQEISPPSLLALIGNQLIRERREHRQREQATANPSSEVERVLPVAPTEHTRTLVASSVGRGGVRGRNEGARAHNGTRRERLQRVLQEALSILDEDDENWAL